VTVTAEGQLYYIGWESRSAHTEETWKILAGLCLCHCCLFSVSNSGLLFSHGRPSL